MLRHRLLHLSRPQLNRRVRGVSTPRPKNSEVFEAGSAEGMERRRYSFGAAFCSMPIGKRCFATAQPVIIGTKSIWRCMRVRRRPGNGRSRRRAASTRRPDGHGDREAICGQVANLRRLLGPNPQGGEWIVNRWRGSRLRFDGESMIGATSSQPSVQATVLVQPFVV